PERDHQGSSRTPIALCRTGERGVGIWIGANACGKGGNAKRRERLLSAFAGNSWAAFVCGERDSSPRGTLFVTIRASGKDVSRYDGTDKRLHRGILASKARKAPQAAPKQPTGS